MTQLATSPLVEQPAATQPHRCLILANAKAGSIRTLKERLLETGLRYWHRLTFQAEPEHCDEPPQCIPLLAETASGCGIEAHVETIPPPERIAERCRSAEREGFDTVVAAGGD